MSTEKKIDWIKVLNEHETCDWPIHSAMDCEALTKEEIEQIKLILAKALTRMKYEYQLKLFKQYKDN